MRDVTGLGAFLELSKLLCLPLKGQSQHTWPWVQGRGLSHSLPLCLIPHRRFPGLQIPTSFPGGTSVQKMRHGDGRPVINSRRRAVGVALLSMTPNTNTHPRLALFL